MKTTKITTTLASLILIFFMSTSSIANTYNSYTGDGEKTSAKNQISAVKNKIDAAVSSAISHNDFRHLRFNVNNFVAADNSEISELPLANEFTYLRFDVNTFAASHNAEISELPAVNEFDYLRFEVNNFSANNSVEFSEIPANELHKEILDSAFISHQL